MRSVLTELILSTTYLNIVFREEADLSPGVFTFVPARADVPDQSQKLASLDGQFDWARFAVEVVKGLNLEQMSNQLGDTHITINIESRTIAPAASVYSDANNKRQIIEQALGRTRK